MQSSALSPKAVMLMSKIRRQLVVSGVDMEVIEGMDWSYESFDEVCKRFQAESTYEQLAELSEEVQHGVAENTWSLK